MKSTTVTKVATMENTIGTVPISYHLKSEAFIMVRCQLASIHYTPIQIKNYLKRNSVVNENGHYEKYR